MSDGAPVRNTPCVQQCNDNPCVNNAPFSILEPRCFCHRDRICFFSDICSSVPSPGGPAAPRRTRSGSSAS